MLSRILTYIPLFIPPSLRSKILKSRFIAPVRQFYKQQLPNDPTSLVSLQPPLRGYKMRINLLMDKAFMYGTFEPELCRVILTQVKEGWACMDIGANIGYITLLMAHKVGNQGLVCAFEPLPSNFSVLQENISLNGHNSNVCSECLALSDRSGTENFQFRSEVFTGGGSLVASDPAGVNAEVVTITVNTLSGDEYLARKTLSRPINFIKIDVEGAEGLVLAGLKTTLSTYHPTILLEAHLFDGSTFTQALNILSEFDYKLTYIDESHILAE